MRHTRGFSRNVSPILWACADSWHHRSRQAARPPAAGSRRRCSPQLAVRNTPSPCDLRTGRRCRARCNPHSCVDNFLPVSQRDKRCTFQPGDPARNFTAPGPDQPAKAKDFTLVQGEGQVAEPLVRQPLDAQDLVAARARHLRWIQRFELRPTIALTTSAGSDRRRGRCGYAGHPASRSPAQWQKSRPSGVM